MNWFINPDTIHSLLFGKFSTPPYFLILASLVIIATTGLAFTASLMMQLEIWKSSHFQATSSRWNALQLAFPFTGLSAGVTVLLAGLMMTAGLPILFSSLLALAIALFLGTYAWSRIGQRMSHRMIETYLAEQL